MGGLAWVFRVLVSLYLFSVFWSSGCLQESGNPWGQAGNPRGGCGSLTGYQEGGSREALSLGFLSLPSIPLLQIQAAVHLPR